MSIRSAFSALIGPGAAYAGPDQGIDFTGKAPVYALGDATVTRVQSSGSGWPGQGAVVVYRLNAGPGKGRYVYTAEDFAPASGLKVGSSLKKGDLLGTATGAGLAPGIETGWATAAGIPVAPLEPDHGRSAAAKTIGDNFRQFVAALSGSGPVPTATAEPAPATPAATSRGVAARRTSASGATSARDSRPATRSRSSRPGSAASARHCN
jgi:hypothetical protein